MKKLIMFAAVLGLANVAQAESDWTNNAEYRIRGTVNSGQSLQDDRSSNVINHRLKLTTEYKASDKFSGQVTLVHYSDLGSTGNSSGVPNAATRDTLSDNSSLIVNEAYATWRVSDEFSIKAGRGSFEGADGSSTSTNDFQNALTAFDGVAGIYEHEFARITGFLIKFADVDAAAPSVAVDPEVNTVGVTADLKIAPEIFNMFNVYTNQVRQDAFLTATGQRNKEVYQRYGIVLGGQFAEMVDFKLAYHGYTGEATAANGIVDTGVTNDIVGSMIDAQVGVTMEDMMNMKFHIGYHMDSGSDGTSTDDEHYRAYYYDVHKFAGLMDVVAWGNLTYLHAGFSMEPLENLTLGLQYHMFTATEENGATFRTTDASNAPTVAAGSTTEDEIGSEIDLYATHKYDGGFEVTARYGLFMAGDRFGPNAEDFQQLFLSGTMRF